MQRPEVCIKCLTLSLALLLNLELPNPARSTGQHAQLPFKLRGWGSELGSSRVHDKYFTNVATS